MKKTERTFAPKVCVSEVVDILCSDCQRTTKHDVVVALEETGEECEVDPYGDERYGVSWHEKYQVVRCRGCETISFRRWCSFSEDEESTEFLYPERNASALPTKAFFKVPENLQRIYAEIVKCHNSDCLTLCAAGLRAIVEGVCVDQGVEGGPIEILDAEGNSRMLRKSNLEGKIAGLAERQILTVSSAQTLHEHRYLGNEAVHELVEPSSNELRIAIEIVEHLLEHLYEMPAKAEELKNAASSRKANKR